MQLDDLGVSWNRRATSKILELACGASNLSSTGQKAQHVPGGVALARCRRVGERRRRGVAHVQRVRRARHVDDRTTIEVCGDGSRVEGRRHDDKPQVGTRQPGLFGERDAEVGVDAALVKLVEHDRAKSAKERILHQPGRENALGCKEHDGVGSELPLKADVPAHLGTKRPSLLDSHARGQAAGGNTARLQHDHWPVDSKRWRHTRRLAGARRCCHDDGARVTSAREDLRDEAVDRQWNQRHARSLHTDRPAHQVPAL